MNSSNKNNETKSNTLTENNSADIIENTNYNTNDNTNDNQTDIKTGDINSKAKSLVPEDDEYSIHERIEQIFKETEVDRKTQIAKRIQYGDAFTQAGLSIAFWGFWIFWLIVFLM